MDPSDSAQRTTDLERLARKLGFEAATPALLEDLARAEAYARALADRLPRDHALDDEPAFTFHAGPEPR